MALIVGTTLVVVAAVVVLTSSRPAVVRQTTTAPPSTAPSSTAPPSSTVRPFSADSVWNAPLSEGATISPSSAVYVASLRQQISEYGAWINSKQYSVPVYTVPRAQPRVPVVLDISGRGSVGELATAFHSGVPIPADAQAAVGTDEEMVVWQPSTNRLWEFWRAHQVNGEWHARWGGRLLDVSQSPGFYTNPRDWGGSATSLSLLGGLILDGELRSGVIDHALAIGIVKAAAGRFVFPAERTDGGDRSVSAIPEGTRFRLNPAISIPSLHLPRLVAMIATAAQRYGMIVRDGSGVVTFYAQAPAPGAPSPLYADPKMLEGKAPSQLLSSFPWQDLEVVNP